MKINRINKKDLLVFQDINKIDIYVTGIPVEDLEDEDLTLILTFGDKNNPVNMSQINAATISMLYLLSINSQLKSIPSSLVLTVPENLPNHYPQAIQYPMEQTTWGDFLQELENDEDLVDENWFFISVGHSISDYEISEMYKKIEKTINGLLMKDTIKVYYEC